MRMDKPMSNPKHARRIAAAAAGAVFLLTTALPAFAQSATNTRKDGNACERFTRLASTLETRVSEGRAKLLARRDERKGKLEDRREDREKRLADRREKWEDAWQEKIERLEDKAATNTAAIAAFKTAMAAAWKTRNAAIDAANKAFRTGLEKLIAEKKTAVENASLALKTSISAAFAKAKADCASGVAPETVMTNLRASLKAAQDKFKTDRQAIDGIGAKVKDLVKVRQAAVEKAKADFKTAAEKARADLKAALKASKPNDSATGTKEHDDEDED
jgi:hypothetical protein